MLVETHILQLSPANSSNAVKQSQKMTCLGNDYYTKTAVHYY